MVATRVSSLNAAIGALDLTDMFTIPWTSGGFQGRDKGGADNGKSYDDNQELELHVRNRFVFRVWGIRFVVFSFVLDIIPMF